MVKSTWLEKVGSDLAHVCNGNVTKEHKHSVRCMMTNGTVTASIAGDGTRMLIVRKQNTVRVGSALQKVTMESQSDEMVITRSLSGSIEFLHKMGNNPEVRIEQKGKRLGAIKINAYNDKVKTALYGNFD